MRMYQLTLIVFTSIIVAVLGHVRLDFPVGRDFNLDFLDNFRTPPPCGMPKGISKTTFETGTTFNATWHLGYPHKGGYMLELFDANENYLQHLTPEFGGSKSDGWLDDDITAQSHIVTLPDEECIGCTIRLQRQAKEWGNRYKFWSCADVDIIRKGGSMTDKILCSNHGQMQMGSCVCEDNYYGSRCQYENECSKDEDCLNGGVCIDTAATTPPSMQCYCADGYFGTHCEKKSNLVSQDIQDLSNHEKRTVNERLDILWRILSSSNEIEIVLKAKSKTFVAVGWRPLDIDASCQAFPELEEQLEDNDKSGSPEAEAESEPESDAESEPESEVESEPESEAEAESEPESEAESEPESEAESEPESEAESEPEAESESESKAESEPESESEAESEPESEAEAESESEAEPESESEAEAESESEAEAESESEAEAESEPEAEAESEYKKKAASGAKSKSKTHEYYKIRKSKFQPKSKGLLKPMDCSDIVIGMAKGQYSKVYDAYTRDRSTPMADSFYGGKDDLTGALAFQKMEDGVEVTTVAFRKKLSGTEKTDHTITNGLINVIWAMGQEYGMYHHSPASGLKSSNKDFYKEDELKYHGRTNRGSMTMNFFDVTPKSDVTSPKCSVGMWKFPSECSVQAGDCQYVAEYKNVGNNMLHVEVQQKLPFGNAGKWVAIGFSNNNKMPETDIVAGYFDSNGIGVVKDYWSSTYIPPSVDVSQDITDTSLTMEDGKLKMTFKKILNSEDKREDADFTNGPVHIIYPFSGGSVYGSIIGRHFSTPYVTPEKKELTMTCV